MTRDEWEKVIGPRVLRESNEILVYIGVPLFGASDRMWAEVKRVAGDVGWDELAVVYVDANDKGMILSYDLGIKRLPALVCIKADGEEIGRVEGTVPSGVLAETVDRWLGNKKEENGAEA